MGRVRPRSPNTHRKRDGVAGNGAAEQPNAPVMYLFYIN